MSPTTMKPTGVGLGDLTKGFPFVLPTRIEFGLGVADRVGDEARQFGNRALIVSDPGVQQAGLVARIQKQLELSGLVVEVYAGVEANPRVATVDEIAGFARDRASEVIVAVGGGSAIDSAKAASAVARFGGTVLDYEGLERVPGPGIPVVAIPTTAGTGSEVTLWAIVTDPARQFKAPIGSFHLAPRVALVDPLTTLSLPAMLTASTGIDALTHAIEAYTARCSNPISDALVLYAIELISTYVERATQHGDDLEARSAMMLGSLLAGIGFGNSDTAAVHSMAEALGAIFDVGHGTANAIFLPVVMAHNMSAALDRTARIAVAMGLDANGLSTVAAAEASVAAVTGLTSRLGIPTLAEVGITDADLPKLAATAMMNSGTPDNPVEMNEASFQDLFATALHSGGPA